MNWKQRFAKWLRKWVNAIENAEWTVEHPEGSIVRYARRLTESEARGIQDLIAGKAHIRHYSNKKERKAKPAILSNGISR